MSDITQTERECRVRWAVASVVWELRGKAREAFGLPEDEMPPMLDEVAGILLAEDPVAAFRGSRFSGNERWR